MFRPSVHVTRRFATRYFCTVSEFQETDASYRELYEGEELGLRTTKIENLNQGDWMMHHTGQPGVIRKMSSKNRGCGRGASRYEFDFRLALPLVAAWESFSGIPAAKSYTVFKKPADHLHLFLGHTESEDFHHITVLNDLSEPMTVRINKDRYKECNEFTKALAEKQEKESVMVHIQEVPIKRNDGSFHMGQTVRKTDNVATNVDSEFQYLYHEDDDKKAVLSCINDEGDPIDLTINKVVDTGTLWSKINADIETYEATGTLMYITCTSLEGRLGPLRVVVGTRFDEM